jgi:hypothetical protein
MKPVIQLEKTGCAIASVAAVAGVTYQEAKRAANALGIFADDHRLWSETFYVRRLLKHFKISVSAKQMPFKSWESLPNVALLAIKWHIENHKAFWHWAVFVRESGRFYVLDSKKGLRDHVRTDFGRMKPKWFIRLGR